MVPHRAIVNRLLWMQETWPLAAGDRVLQKTPFGFDASVWEVFVPLLSGATVVMAEPEGHRDPEYLVRAIREQGVTVVQFVPSQLRLVLAQGGLGECPALRRVFSGGEALPGALREAFFAASGAELVNLYGPTEVAIDATAERCVRGERLAGVTIGRPIANDRVYVLAGELEPVPAGVAGHLCVGGAGVSWGYRGKPGLTAERFVPDPLSGIAGGRLYRTGDRARHLPGGRLEYLGRMDEQVKVRGVRIELGEIEGLLRTAPGVGEAAAAVRQGEDGEERLVAWVSATEPGALEVPAVREHLRRHLPEVMMPSAVVEVGEMPHLPNGKVDRGALPDPGDPVHGLDRTFVPPRTPVEETVAEVWRELLGTARPGVHDDFFDLGGHSIIATQLMARLRRIFDLELPLRHLFEAPTIAGLGERIEAELAGGAAVRSAPLTTTEAGGAAPASFAQQRLWFLEQMVGGETSAYNIPAAVFLRGALVVPILRAALDEVVRRHDVLRTTFAQVEDRLEQRVAPAVPVPLPIADLSALPPDAARGETARVARNQGTRRFDLAAGPLLRIGLVRRAPAEHVLLTTLHHTISDGWSSGLLIGELGELYRAFVEGRPSPLPAPRLQYADFARWQRRRLDAEALEDQLGYWRQQLAGLPPALDLPPDYPRRTAGDSPGGSVALRIEAAEVEALRRIAREEGGTLFMALLAVFQMLLCRYSGQDDFAVGTPVAGRDRPELERLIGCFVNTLVLRADLSGRPGLRQVLSRVRRVAVEAFGHQDVPFERLVEELRPGRDLAHTPLFQTMFVLQNAPASGISDLPGLRLVPYEEPDSAAAKFDLTLFLAEVDGALEGSLEFRRDLFHPLTARRLRRALRKPPRRRRGRARPGPRHPAPRAAGGVAGGACRGGGRRRPGAAPRGRRRGGAPPSRRDGGDRRRRADLLRRARPPGGGPRRGAGAPRRRAGGAGGSGAGAFAGAARRHAGGAQGRGSLRAPRPLAPAPATDRAARRRRSPDRRRPRRDLRGSRRRGRRLGAHGGRAGRFSARRRSTALRRADGPRPRRLRDVHLGLDRQAEGRGGQPPQPDALPVLVRRELPAARQRGHAGPHLAGLRPHPHGPPRAAPRRRAGGARPRGTGRRGAGGGAGPPRRARAGQAHPGAPRSARQPPRSGRAGGAGRGLRDRRRSAAGGDLRTLAAAGPGDGAVQRVRPDRGAPSVAPSTASPPATRSRCPSDGRPPARACGCSTAVSSRCRRACAASSTSAARGWPAVTPGSPP